MKGILISVISFKKKTKNNAHRIIKSLELEGAIKGHEA